jgi:hypothetical protein
VKDLEARAVCLALSYQLQAAPSLAELLRRVALSGYMRGCVRGITRSSTGKTSARGRRPAGRLSYRRAAARGKLTLRGKQPRKEQP